MNPLQPPLWSNTWGHFATWGDVPFALLGLLLCALLILWWRQQSSRWFSVTVGALLAALLLAIASFFIFVVPPHFAGCPTGCTGWRGYPLRMALVRLDGQSEVAALDFALNLLMLWLLMLTASVAWRILAETLQMETRGRRWRTLFILFFVLLPWALLPRILNPPQPQVLGEDMRLANNALRAAEFTYGITGVWVQRLSVEDVRRNAPSGQEALAAERSASGNQVCLRAYTYFYIPWQRYRIGLDPNGASPISMVPVPLRGSCW